MSHPQTPEKSATELPAALAQLFRHSLREGRVHPLLHLLRRYREEQPQ